MNMLRTYFLLKLFPAMLFMLSIPSVSQNLVLNPGFEQVNGSSLLCTAYGLPGSQFFNPAMIDWTCPTDASTDIYSTSLPVTCMSNPLLAAWFGPQAPRTGNAMVGYAFFAPTAQGCPYREYVQGHLSSPLVAGTSYHISFYMSLGDDCMFAVSSIGVKFGTAPLNINNMCPIITTPDVSYNGPPITNKTGWTRLEFCYTPTVSGQEYFIIGNFLSNAATTVTNLPGNEAFSYYYIDDVSVMPSVSLPNLTVTASSHCTGPTATLTALPAGLNYTWTAPPGGSIVNGTFPSAAIVQGSGIFTVSAQSSSLCGAAPVSSATVMVNFAGGVPPAVPVISGSGTITCTTPSLTLSTASFPGLVYTWAGLGVVSGNNTPQAIINVAGSYSVTVLNASGCQATATVAIPKNVALPTLSPLLSGTTSCTTPTVQIATILNPPSSTFTWVAPPTGTLSNSSVINPVASGAGVFTVSATHPLSGCKKTAFTVITASASTTTLSVNHASVCAGNSATLTVQGNAPSYAWGPSASLSSTSGSVIIANPSVTTVYTVTSSSGSCPATATVSVSVFPYPVLTTAANPTICSGNTTALSASGAGNYNWAPSAGLMSSTGATVMASPSVTTTYTVTGTTSACAASRILTVFVMPSPVANVTASPSSVCSGGSSSLSVSGTGTYTWSTGSSASSIMVSPQSTTIYTVSGANASCAASATVEVAVMQVTSLQVNAVAPVCYGQSLALTATGATTYNWQPSAGITDPHNGSIRIKPTANTVYSVTAVSPGRCPVTQTLGVTVYPVPHVYAGRDTIIDREESVKLSGSGDVDVAFFSMSAEPLDCYFCSSLTVSPSETTCYLLKGENTYGCFGLDTLCVQVDRSYGLYVPNTFTPNADGMNDVFIPVTYGLVEIRLRIFDRWGIQVFTGEGNSAGWDGNYKGKLCGQGVYVYQVEAKIPGGNAITRTGHVNLLPQEN